MGAMDGKVVVVTGGNTGIGKATALGLARQGASVVLACRDVAKGEAARVEIAGSVPGADVRVRALDLGKLASVRDFVDSVSRELPRLDVLVNNAGAWPRTRQTTADGLELTFGTNHVGHFVLTNGLLPLLRESAPARIVNISSVLHYRGVMDWDDLQFDRKPYSGTAAYNQSKLANVLFTQALARRLEGTGVVVNAVHPGVVHTELARDFPRLLTAIFHLFTLTPEQGARTSLHVATAPETATMTGKYFEKSRAKTPAKAARDVEAQERLWAVTEQLVATISARAAA
jgi:NAD(P)-dependent dehydrogenase (short-subunit alcohol dehydrogenase family)